MIQDWNQQFWEAYKLRYGRRCTGTCRRGLQRSPSSSRSSSCSPSSADSHRHRRPHKHRHYSSTSSTSMTSSSSPHCRHQHGHRHHHRDSSEDWAPPFGISLRSAPLQVPGAPDLPGPPASRPPPLPASKLTITYFAAELSLSLAPSTISVYVAAVAALHRRAGLRDPTRHNPLLQLAKRGIKRSRSAPTSTSRRPITTSLLADLVVALRLSRYLSRGDRHMLAATFTLAFFGFLWISEFSAPSPRCFDPRVHAATSDIHWAGDHFTFHLHHSKTDQCSHGQSICIPHIGGPLCPFTAMAQYASSRAPVRNPGHTPLFIFTTGCPLTQASFLSNL